MISRRSFMRRENDSKRLYLYKNGNECKSVTGGWSTDRGFFIDKDYTIVKNSNSIELTAGLNRSSGGCTVATQKPINLTGYKKLYFDGIIYIEKTASLVGDVAILQVDTIKGVADIWDLCFTGLQAVYYRGADNVEKENIDGVVSFDLRDISNPKHICFQLHAYPGQPNVLMKIIIRQLWLE